MSPWRRHGAGTQSFSSRGHRTFPAAARRRRRGIPRADAGPVAGGHAAAVRRSDGPAAGRARGRGTARVRCPPAGHAAAAWRPAAQDALPAHDDPRGPAGRVPHRREVHALRAGQLPRAGGVAGRNPPRLTPGMIMHRILLLVIALFITPALAAIPAAPERDAGEGPFPRLILRGAILVDGTG